MTIILEGLRMFKRSLRVRASGFGTYGGDAKNICKKIIEDCWNGQYYQVSNGHFIEFYTRDFGWCTPSLLKLGHRDRVIKTLEYALRQFKDTGVKTSINPKGTPFDFPKFAPDSLAYLLRSLRLAKAGELIKENKEFLENETEQYFKKVIEPETGLVKKEHFSSMKDHSIRQSSCYDNCMVSMLSDNLQALKLNNPFKQYNYKKIIKENFWNGKYFLDDLSRKDYVAADSNIFPFICEVFDDKKMLKKSIEAMQQDGLDKPFPLKYSNSDEVTLSIHDMFAKGYEEKSIWTHMGPLYIQLVQKIDKRKAKVYLNQYKRLIEQHQNYLEVFNSKGKPFKRTLYITDEGMLWSSMILEMIK